MNQRPVIFAVEDLATGIHFYSTMFAREPAVRTPGYAKWTLDDQRVNFAITVRNSATSSPSQEFSPLPAPGAG